MSTDHFRWRHLCLLLALVSASQAVARDGPIRPFKDELFSRQAVIESRDGGAFQIIDYQEMRDINGRDEEPERRVKSAYVDTGVRRSQTNETLALAASRLDVARVGPLRDAGFTVIFIHGRGGDRRLGVNDFTFGGNFNRLKNLVLRNGGVYYAPSVKTFDPNGAADIAALVRHVFELSKGRPVVLACASMGGFICQSISRDKEAVRYLKGLVMMGGPPDPGFLTTPAARLKLPVFLAHGSNDSVYPAQNQVALYEKMRARNYPAQLRLFNTGGHGTPIRMSDWREILNFLLASP
ncbi:alpha/beta hydrolase [Rhizobium sp. SSA_523]|uniref:alpha/beta hydrolase n=1 Tax=Rhizobium sp. SSA_523 TaxID=2952477 RepID=UPI002090F189|nr:alpha/beta fold hydrolase [Rhizobium sp. SSA_523]MCO5733783.1 alpha/beta fold hydrolase [Rhizobium sp. SSA_523]WKC24942.1 alpha/beta fold hydrolase [Rhizobium sp. SSA_523]